MQQSWKKKSERGFALLVALFALILITAIGLGMIFSSNSEFAVNGSFRQNHLAFFAARSGLEEARDRMRYASTDPITTASPLGMGISDFLPTVPIGQNNSVLYITNVSGIDPTDYNNNTYFDDELCHEINNQSVISNSPGTYNIKCPHTSYSIPPNPGPGSWYTIKSSEPIPSGGGTISYAWTRINLKLQESTSPWCVLGFGSCNPEPTLDSVSDQVCYDGSREFVLTDARPLRDAPGGIGGIGPAQQLAAGMFFGTTSSHGNSGHSATTGSSTSTGTSSSSSSSSSTSSSSGTSGSGTTGSSSTTGSGSTTGSTTATSTTGSSTTGSSTTATSTTGSSTTGSSTTATSTTGSSTTGSSTTATSTTGSSTTGSSTTATSTTGSSTTGSSTTATSTTGSSTTGSSTTATSTTGSSSSSSTTGSSTTGTSGTGTTGTSTTGSSSGSTTGGTTGSGGACSGTYTPPAPPAYTTATSCTNANAQPVYTVTTLAFTPSKARRMLQYEIARLTVPPVPAALTMAGPTPSFGTPNSNNFGISGLDDTTDGCNGFNVQENDLPAIGTTTDVANTQAGDSSAAVTASKAAASIAGAIAKPLNFYGLGCPQNQGDDVQSVIGVAPSYSTVDGLNAVVQSVIGAADQIASSDTGVSNWGTDTNPQTIAIEGNATLSSGSGILLVTGNATAKGDWSWNGIVLIIGNGSLNVNGGGSGKIFGAMVIANIGDSSYATDPTDYTGHLLPALGTPSFNWNGGGKNFFQYDSCYTTAASSHSTFKVLARREIVY